MKKKGIREEGDEEEWRGRGKRGQKEEEVERRGDYGVHEKLLRGRRH